jgi:hypothetical protein
MAEHARAKGTSFETPNALGMLWRRVPILADRLTKMHNYAKAVQTYLRAVDLYCMEKGISPAKVRVDTEVRDGRLIQRIIG